MLLHRLCDFGLKVSHCLRERRSLAALSVPLMLTCVHRLSTYGRRAFAVAGPMTFNALPDELCDPTVNITTFETTFKDTFFLELSTRLAH